MSSGIPVFSQHQRCCCPEGAEVCSQGREPLAQVSPTSMSPEGAAERLFAPNGTICADAIGELHPYGFKTDQTDLQILTRQVGATLEAYPVLGQP